MRTAGIICEYNPLHAGHVYHIRETRNRTNTDLIVCLMSGEFTQRGEPAVCDKWTRARMALSAGADVVLELPFSFAARSAEHFALGAVRILEALHIDVLSFGSETTDTELLQAAASILHREPPRFREALRIGLDAGLPYGTARRNALAATRLDLSDLMSQPNSILGIEYLRALRKTESSMEPLAVTRDGAGHDAPWTPGTTPSSSAVRSALFASPGEVPRILDAAGTPVQFAPAQWKKPLFTLLSGKLRCADPTSLSDLADMETGLEWRLVRAAREASDYDSMIQKAASKRYPPSRIRRLYLYALLGLTRKTAARADIDQRFGVRVLGVRKDALHRFGQMCRNADIPIAASPKGLPVASFQQLDAAASDVYGLLLNPVRPAGADFTTPLLLYSARLPTLP